MKLVNYPEDFCNWSDAIHVPIREVQKWTDECIQKLENCEGVVTYHACGNTKVIVIKLKDENGNIGYEVTVAQNYLDCEVWDNER